MKYRISPGRVHERTINVSFTFMAREGTQVVQLPSWRPGRYELGNFAKNIRGFKVTNGKGEKISWKKTAKDTWQILNEKAEEVQISFEYYAAELNAGSSFVDEHLLYVNPVNCLPYLPEKMMEACTLELDIPSRWDVACSLKSNGINTFIAPDFHTLADSPFMASDLLQHNQFVYEGIEFHLWFYGLDKPDWPSLINDFFLFTHEQYELFKGFPSRDYHYLFLATPYKLHHGVEHQHSTVITLGPSSGLMTGDGYRELLAISSHELFHTWNVKAIRPVEMFPYEYGRENYSRLGYVYEGVTTYYGDLMLYRGRVFDTAEYLTSLQRQVQRHFDNPGRMRMGVAEASFDTWLDGYIPGMPGRKTNIYTEGALLAFICDTLIRKHTGNSRSLDDVLRRLYHDFAGKKKGYTEEDYRQLVNEAAGVSLSVFDELADNPGDFLPYLSSCFNYYGLKLESGPVSRQTDGNLGIRLLPGSGIVAAVWPGSPADESGMTPGDDIIAIDGIRVNNDPDPWIRGKNEVTVSFFRDHRLLSREVKLKQGGGYSQFRLSTMPNPGEESKSAFKSWTGNAYPG